MSEMRRGIFAVNRRQGILTDWLGMTQQYRLSELAGIDQRDDRASSFWPINLVLLALGAAILERHYTDTRYRKGPDIINSMDPAELRFLIDRSREIWIAANNPKARSAAEEPVYRFARASVVADRDLAAGHVIGESDIWARRPGSGEIAGYEFDKLLGRRLTRAVTRNTQLRWSDLED